MEYVMTIRDDDTDSGSESEETTMVAPLKKTKARKNVKSKNKKNGKDEEKKHAEKDREVMRTFVFHDATKEDESLLHDDNPSSWDFKTPSNQLLAKGNRISFAQSLNDKIQKRRSQREKIEEEDDDLAVGFSEDEAENGEEEDSQIQSRPEMSGAILESEEQRKLSDSANEPKDTAVAKAFFDTDSTSSHPLASSFLELNLSRPLLRAISRLRYQRPTPIQSKAIPLALAGRDICASAQTGSGKTAAFLLPVFERMLFRPQDVSVTRVLIITPTRELATQIHSMGKKLAEFTNIRLALVVGGLSLKSQAVELRTRPDIVVCTPGRMIDHVQNTLSVHMDDIEILILDEADRLLDEGFTDEVHELVKHCSRGRQTMLFSATMTDQVEQLVKLSLNRPVRVTIGAVDNVADRLVQEFVRIRQRKHAANVSRANAQKKGSKHLALRDATEDDREAIVSAICVRSCSSHTILFCDTKRQAHRMVIVLGLLGLKAAELHGNLTQKQRLESLELFKRGDVSILVATDLASRGLDVPGVETVVNMSMPRQIERYIHRVGRTARAGRGGRSITLVGDIGRSVMKRVVKQQRKSEKSACLRSRRVPAAVILHWKRRIADIEEDVAGILEEERIERKLLRAEMEAQKAMNIMEHSDEIKSRPPRTWFQSESEKQAVKEKTAAAARQEFAEAKARLKRKKTRPKSKPGTHRMTRKKRRKQEMDRMDALDEIHEKKMSRINSKIRVAKRKEKKEQVELLGRQKPKKKKKKKKKRRSVASSEE